MARILLIVTGSIAAIKIPDFIRRAKEQGHDVTCVLTKSAANFVTPLSLAYLSGNKVYEHMFNPDEESEMAHISLSRNNDVILIAPASADFLAKMANGFCDDLASTIYMASDKPVVVAPAMNTKMFEHPATKRNIAQLKKDNVLFIEPVSGKLACGEEGLGKMSEPEDILNYLKGFLKNTPARKTNIQNLKQKTLVGVRCLVTSGPTRENIDPVRYISNYSSGKQGYALAESLANEGAEVYLVSGPTSLETPEGVKLVPVESAQQMLDTCVKLLPVDVAICAAAVADWKPENKSDHKIKKQPDHQPQILSLIENPDILFELSKPGKTRPSLVIGFAAETEHLIENAMVKMERKGCDWIVANNVLEDKVFGSDKNSVCIITKDIQECLDDKPKEEIANRIVDLISEHISKLKKKPLKVVN
jgi:phosphopantothenoylcysteine decarboxylase/phosphopantothenate--cysteine ligase